VSWESSALPCPKTDAGARPGLSSFLPRVARNFAADLVEAGRRFRFLIRDRDPKFTTSFDAVFASIGIEAIRTPVQSPNANAFAERWARTVREECLDHLLMSPCSPSTSTITTRPVLTGDYSSRSRRRDSGPRPSARFASLTEAALAPISASLAVTRRQFVDSEPSG
jgi:transposase InsO family protein